jgi:hypothetical protein
MYKNSIRIFAAIALAAISLAGLAACEGQKDENVLAGNWQIAEITPSASHDSSSSSLLGLVLTQDPHMHHISFTPDNKLVIYTEDDKVLSEGSYKLDNDMQKVTMNFENSTDEYSISKSDNKELVLHPIDAKNGMEITLQPFVSYAHAQIDSCLGEKKKIVIDHQMPYLTVKLGNAEGEFVLDFGTNITSIDPENFKNSVKPEPIGGGQLEYEKFYKFKNFNFYNYPGEVNLLIRKSQVSGLKFKQAGVIGTDFFMEAIFTIDYQNGFLYKSSKDSFCKDKVLNDAGFKAVSTAGYYVDNFDRLLDPKTTINVPTVPVKIATVTAVAQIDPAYDDGVYRHTVNINQAFFESLKSAGVKLEKITDVQLSTCTGASETVSSYRLGKGYSFQIMGIDGSPVVIANDAHIFVKGNSQETQKCGGIGTWKIPAAQIGASFLNDSEKVIFDPFTSRVWFKMKSTR